MSRRKVYNPLPDFFEDLRDRILDGFDSLKTRMPGAAEKEKSPVSKEKSPVSKEKSPVLKEKSPESEEPKKWLQKPAVRFGIPAAAAVAVILICVGVSSGKAEQERLAAEAAAAAAAEAAQAEEDTGRHPAPDGTLAPEAEDGTGEAGIMKLTDEMLASSTETGWHYTFKGMWYSMTSGLCWYNGWQEVEGKLYHFGPEGYRDVGWKRIGGQACCFSNDGVYLPDASTDKIVAFTFDDGPSHGTDEILDLCQETGARVTFFMIGVQVENGGAVIPRILQDHCQLGNHSYTHSLMLGKTPEECAADFAQCDEFIRSFSGGIEADIVRFPYGDVTDELTQAVGKPCILWDIDSLDWESQNTEAVLNEVYRQLDDGNIILMHDPYETTVEACRQLFPDLIAQGYQLVTVEELSIAKGVEMQPGAVYFDFSNV